MDILRKFQWFHSIQYEKAVPFLNSYYNLKNHPEILSFYAKSLVAVRNRQMLWSPEVVELNKRI